MNKKKYVMVMLVTLSILFCTSFVFAEGRIKLATTTSTENSGLLYELLPLLKSSSI